MPQPSVPKGHLICLTRLTGCFSSCSRTCSIRPDEITVVGCSRSFHQCSPIFVENLA
ncbi:unnamed protein product [Rhodiola kirilowii]